MNPPTFGTHIIASIDSHDIVARVDRDVLFAARWNLKADLTGEAWRERIAEVAEPTLTRLTTLTMTRALLKPRVVYGFFPCEKKGNLLFVPLGARMLRFDFPRERTTPNRCLTDFFPDKFVTMALVTIGNEIDREGARLFKDNQYADAFYLKGFAAELTEALANLVHARIAQELGFEAGAGVRFSFGYPQCPNLLDQEKLVQLLDARRIGVTLTRTMHLIPEHSTSALISFDPRAARFIP